MPGILDEPPSTFYEMIHIERVRLMWTTEQIREFAQAAIGKTEPDKFTPADWMNLVYALRRCD